MELKMENETKLELTEQMLRTKLDVYAEDLSQSDKDKIEVVYDEILDRVWDFEEVIQTEEDLNKRLIDLFEDYLNE
jgi:hypothetical protein